MTIAIALNTYDGFVLAADTAITIKTGDGAMRTYYNAEKVLPLSAKLPLGVLYCGAACLGTLPIPAIVRDFGKDKVEPLAGGNYTVKDVAHNLSTHIQELLTGQEEPSALFVVGYSSDGKLDGYRILFPEEVPSVTQVFEPDSYELYLDGNCGLLERVVSGWSQCTEDALQQDCGMEPERATSVTRAIEGRSRIDLIAGNMPINDAARLAKHLVRTMIGFAAFVPGSMIGGRAKVATVTKHGGFQWYR